MKKRSIGSRLLSALLAVVMVIGMVPAMRFSASAITSEGHGMSLTSKDYITMPIKIMDYEADGMLFDYLMGRNGYVDTTSYVPESPYWMDFTGTLTDSSATGNGKATSAGGRNVYHGSGIESVSLATTGGTYGGSKWATISSSSLGGKSLLHIVNNKTNGIPLQWQIADFNGSKNVKDVRYAVIVFRAYNCSTLSAPQISISKNLSETKSVREQSGAYSGPYYLNKSGTVNVCGDRHVDMAVIDLKNLTGTVDKLYLEFPMDTSLTDVDEKQSDGTTKKVRPSGAKFDLISVGFFPNEGDAYQYGYWASTLGAASDTDYWDSAKTDAIPKDDYDNNNQGFSFLTDSTSTFGNVGNIVKWLAASSDGVPRTTAGQQPLIAYKTTDLTDYDDPYEFNIWTNTSSNFAWSGTNTVTVEEALGYRLYQVVGQSQANGYATIGLLESSLDENGLPVYKKSVLNYMQIFLRNRMRDVYEFELDGWRNYSAIAGTPNGEIFGYTDGGMVDMDPNISGIQGVPMDFATALCKQLNVTRRTVDKANGVQTTGKVGSYEATMKKRKYLEGSWLDCKQYITSWWDAAYYMMHNLWVPNSYNKLQSDYNYMNLYKSTNTSSTSYGHYVFDSSLTSVNASPYTSGVTYNKTTKTIGLSGATYTAYFGAGEAYNPFVPVHYKGGAAGESNTPYYLDDGVNSYSGYGGNLWYDNQNFGYSLVCNGEFSYKYGDKLMFNFDGDDDVYLFINGELVLDMGGTHNNTNAIMYLNHYVDWARDVLKNRKNHSLEEVARAEKLNLRDGETYSFDFYYMERHGTGANLRIETNINVVVPDLAVEKSAWQSGVEIPDNGVVDNTQPVEYGFSLTNDGDTSKLYNLTFSDSEIGVTLNPTDGLVVKYPSLTRDKNGGLLDVTDLEAWITGYTSDPRRPGAQVIEPIKVTFDTNDELKAFLKNLYSDAGTETHATDGLFEGDGLWAFGTVTMRGFYYTQTPSEQNSNSFTNPLTVTATNGAYKLSGSDTHTVFAFGEPAYFQWANHKIVIDSEKLYEDLKNSKTYGDKDIPAPGHMAITLCDGVGNPMEYPCVSNSVGGDVYITAAYKTAGLYTVYANISDKTGAAPTFTIAIMFYVLDDKDTAVVLDYGLVADLSSGNSLLGKDVLNLAGKEVLNTVIGITGVSGTVEYIEQDVSNLHAVVNTENAITPVSANKSSYIGKFDTPVYLRHDLPWVIEWKTNGSHSGGLMFSMTEVGATADNLYIYTRNYSNGKETSSNPDFIALGHYHNGAYDNYGVNLTAKGYSLNTAQTYRLENRPNTDGTNKVYVHINGTEVGSLDTYWIATTQQSTDVSYISGKDFTFNYLGAGGHPIDLTNYEYIHLYEDGFELKNYRWEASALNNLHAVSTGEPGNIVNTNAWALGGSSDDTEGYYGKLKNYVQLNCDKQWVVEFKLSGLDLAGVAGNGNARDEEVMLFSSTGTTEHEYIYLRADSGLVAFGTSDTAGYHNFGIALKDIDPSFNTSAEHVYRIENRINTDGTCMAYLIVDGKEMGPMNNEFSSGAALPGVTGDMFTGNNMMFTHIGHKSGHWAVDAIVHYLQVWEDTSLSGTYGWVKGSDGLLTDASVSDTHGNRIEFTGMTEGEIAGTDGTFYIEDGKLTFQPSQFMNDELNQIKVAFTAHERGFLPTPLADKYVDIANEVQIFRTVTVIPATVVYYEDDFPAIKYVGSEVENNFRPLGTGSGDLTQDANQSTNYGSDDAYDDAGTNMSGDSLHELTIDHLGPMAYFEFTGSGFEIIAQTNAVDSGLIFVEVYNKADVIFENGNLSYNAQTGMVNLVSNASAVAMIPVITEYDNKDDMGAEVLYQVPIIRVDDLAIKDYIVVISGVPSQTFDENGNVTGMLDTKLYLDGIRVFQPIGSTNVNYSDVENGAVFSEIRNEIIDGNIAAADCGDGISISAGLTTWTENHISSGSYGQEYVGQEVSSVNDYLTLGPNNEVYMDGTFTKSGLVMMVKETDADVHDLQIAMRAIDYGKFIGAGYTYESATLVYGTVNDSGEMVWKNLVTICTPTEQYYTIPYTEGAVIGGYHMVVLQVIPAVEDVPAMISFSSLKYKGLELGSVNAMATNGVAELSGDDVLNLMNEQLSSNIIETGNESELGGFDKDNNESADALLVPTSSSLSFEDEIRYNIYFTVDGLTDFNTAEMGLITFGSKLNDGTIADAVDVIPGASFNGSEYMVHTNGIPAKNMGDTLYFKVYAKLSDGSYVYSDVYGYSALAYAKNRLANSQDDSLKSLVVAMLNYGAAAQMYFGYNTDALMNADLTADQLALAGAYDAAMMEDISSADAAKTGNFAMTEGSFLSVQPSVSFEGAFSVNFYYEPGFAVDDGMTLYYWTEDAYNNVELLTLENATGSVSMQSEGGIFCAAVEDIAAKALDKAIYVVAVYESNGISYTSNVGAYSVGTYCDRFAANDASDIQELASATAVYGYYAKCYFAE
ncbi:MAG: fibro-slime domain-containing protein [Oscillospiraceae bacterium]|nr:fibro-slime domain-containing protein [Oscillospiraceae bacterium]